MSESTRLLRATIMRKQLLHLAAIACVGLAGASSLAQTQRADAALTNGPDPREIPVPRIATPLGTLPGVNELPTRTAMPDVMVMNDGTRVTTGANGKHGARKCGASFRTTPSDRCRPRQGT